MFHHKLLRKQSLQTKKPLAIPAKKIKINAKYQSPLKSKMMPPINPENPAKKEKKVITIVRIACINFNTTKYARLILSCMFVHVFLIISGY